MVPSKSKLLPLLVLATVSMAAAVLRAEAAEPAAARAHCNWGDLGCNNPPPKLAPAAAVQAPAARTGADARRVPATPAMPRPTALAGPGRAKAECNRELSTPDECWTNCKTEDEITICDIIKLDTFMPESRGGPTTDIRALGGGTVTKLHRGHRTAVGRFVTQ